MTKWCDWLCRSEQTNIKKRIFVPKKKKKEKKERKKEATPNNSSSLLRPNQDGVLCPARPASLGDQRNAHFIASLCFFLSLSFSLSSWSTKLNYNPIPSQRNKTPLRSICFLPSLNNFPLLIYCRLPQSDSIRSRRENPAIDGSRVRCDCRTVLEVGPVMGLKSVGLEGSKHLRSG